MFLGLYCSKEREEFYHNMWNDSEQISYQYFSKKDYSSLREFINHTKSLYNFEALLIDLSDYDIVNQNDIIIPLKNFKEYSSVRMILVLNSIHKNLEQSLIKNNIYNILFDTSAENEFERAVTQGDNFNNTINKKYISKMNTAKSDINYFSVPDDKKINIGITGTASRVGTTTFALTLCNWFANRNIRARYINDIDTIKMFSEFYECLETDADTIQIKNLILSTKSYETGINIFDDCDVETYENCDIQIVCSTAKPWDLIIAKDFIKDYPNTVIVFNLATDEEKTMTDNLFADFKHFYISFMDWNICSDETDKILYENIRPIIQKLL